MGQIIYQNIYTCDICDKTPENGEKLWHIGSEVWCEECCNRSDNEDEEEVKT